MDADVLVDDRPEAPPEPEAQGGDPGALGPLSEVEVRPIPHSIIWAVAHSNFWAVRHSMFGRSYALNNLGGRRYTLNYLGGSINYLQWFGTPQIRGVDSNNYLQHIRPP